MVVGNFTTEVDVLVIGSGPGGYVAAIRAAQLGKSVVIVDKSEIGGVCLNRGCIPSKALISAASQYENAQNSSQMGIEVEGVKVDFSKVQQWKNEIVGKLTGGVSSLLKGNKVEIVQGEAFFIEPNVVSISSENAGNRYQFNHCIIATGSRPIEINGFPIGERILTSTEALNLQEIPKKLVVIGGGYIGIELGQTFAKFGTEVTIIEGADSILSGFERQMSQLVDRNLKKAGAQIYTNAKALSADVEGDEVTVKYEVNGEEQTVVADYLLMTVGRRPNTDEMGLESIGVELDEKGFIKIDEQCETSVSNIYAIGDIVPGLALAHKASYEGKVAAEAIAGLKSVIDYKVIPAVVFSDPEIASVGINETEAKEEGYEVIVGRFPFAANGRALSLNASDGFVKVIADKATGLVLGGQIVGAEASNLIAELGLAIEMGTTLEDIALTIHAHPTLGEIVMEAAEGALGRAIHQMNK